MIVQRFNDLTNLIILYLELQERSTKLIRKQSIIYMNKYFPKTNNQ